MMIRGKQMLKNVPRSGKLREDKAEVISVHRKDDSQKEHSFDNSSTQPEKLLTNSDIVFDNSSKGSSNKEKRSSNSEISLKHLDNDLTNTDISLVNAETCLTPSGDMSRTISLPSERGLTNSIPSIKEEEQVKAVTLTDNVLDMDLDTDNETMSIVSPMKRPKFTNSSAKKYCVKRWSCSLCGWFFDCQRFLDDHLLQAHNIGNGVKGLPYRKYMTNRVNTQNSRYAFRCRKCFQIFISRSALRHHLFVKGHHM